MGASITFAGESLIAQKQGAKQTLDVSRFILANVPGLNPNAAVDRTAGKPAASQIVGTYEVTQAGYVNPNQVVYSLMMGSDIGDFDWNWLGLETAEGVLLMVAYLPTQQKRRNIPPLQLGNNVTRNFMVTFDGAQALTGITIDASTWQHDFTVRLAGIDQRERLGNRDMFGRACFFESALQLEKVEGTYRLKPGLAYVEGIRLELKGVQPVMVPATPTTAWLDVVLQRELSDVIGTFKVVFGAALTDYTDSASAQHYLVPLAELPNAAVITDLRPIETITGELIKHFAARVGDYQHLRARATTKGDVGLGNLPNEISSIRSSDSEQVLATTRMVQLVRQLLAPINSPDLTGSPTAPTPPLAMSNNRLATTEFVMRAFHALVDSSPEALSTLRGLAEALGNDPNFATTVLNAIAGKLSLTGGDVTGNVNMSKSLTGGYGKTTGTGNAWAAPIWSIGPAYSGDTAGPTFTTIGMYGLSWIRTAPQGEGVYLYVNGARVGSLAADGIYTAGTYTGKGTGLTDIPQAGVAGLVAALAAKAALASPVFTGTPRSTTPSVTDNSDRISTTAHTQAAIAAALTSPVQGSSTNYSVKLPGGLILKMGTYNKGAYFGEAEQTTITFTDAFPNACLWGGAVPANSFGAANAETMYLLYSKSKNNAVIWAEHVTAGGMNGREFCWFFFGN